MRNLKVLLLAFMAVNAIAHAAPKAPDSGSADCYDRVTNTCNRKHPGQDMGDRAYKNCINDGIDWCDINEPVEASTSRPTSNQATSSSIGGVVRGKSGGSTSSRPQLRKKSRLKFSD